MENKNNIFHNIYLTPKERATRFYAFSVSAKVMGNRFLWDYSGTNITESGQIIRSDSLNNFENQVIGYDNTQLFGNGYFNANKRYFVVHGKYYTREVLKIELGKLLVSGTIKVYDDKGGYNQIEIAGNNYSGSYYFKASSHISNYALADKQFCSFYKSGTSYSTTALYIVAKEGTNFSGNISFDLTESHATSKNAVYQDDFIKHTTRENIPSDAQLTNSPFRTRASLIPATLP